MKKKIVLGMTLLVAGSLALTGCGKKTDKEEPTTDIEDPKPIVDEVELTDKEKEARTLSRALEETSDLVKKMKDVELIDARPQTDIDDPDRLYILDLRLDIKVEDKEEAEKLMEEYSQEFFEEMYKLEKYEEVTITWTSPNHPEGESIEKIDYKG